MDELRWGSLCSIQPRPQPATPAHNTAMPHYQYSPVLRPCPKPSVFVILTRRVLLEVNLVKQADGAVAQRHRARAVLGRVADELAVLELHLGQEGTRAWETDGYVSHKLAMAQLLGSSTCIWFDCSCLAYPPHPSPHGIRPWLPPSPCSQTDRAASSQHPSTLDHTHPARTCILPWL